VTIAPPHQAIATRRVPRGRGRGLVGGLPPRGVQKPRANGPRRKSAGPAARFLEGVKGHPHKRVPSVYKCSVSADAQLRAPMTSQPYGGIVRQSEPLHEGPKDACALTRNIVLSGSMRPLGNQTARSLL
jgi:hypothetical protein